MRLKYLLLGFALVAAPATAAEFADSIKADYDKRLGAMFVDFHRNPELSFKENRTARILAKALRSEGATVTEGVGGTGVVAVMRNGAGPTVLIRADMDGLPVEEKSGVPYSSRARQIGVDGLEMPVMHACGHDVHITSLIGTARQLAAAKDRWRGTIVFIAQPAEERVGGAKAMLADGLYTRFPKPDYALGFHVNSGMRTGTVSGADSLMYSSADSVDIIVHGVGAHGAAPHTGKDPVYIGAQIVTALQSIVSREIGPLSPAVVTVGSFHSGTKHNIISDRADLQVTVRANDEATRKQLLSAIDRIAKGIARAHGVAEKRLPEVKVSEGTPTTSNTPALAQRVRAAWTGALAAGTVVPFAQESMGAEDFTYFVQPELGVPGFYFQVGGTPQAAFNSARSGKAAGAVAPFAFVQNRPGAVGPPRHRGDDGRGSRPVEARGQLGRKLIHKRGKTMKTHLMMTAAALALAACGSSADKADGNGTAAASGGGGGGGAGVSLQPGEWEMKMEVLDVKAEGLPAGMADGMKKSAGNTSRTCMTPEDAKGPKGDLFAGDKSGSCKSEGFKWSGGRIEGKTTCPGQGGTGEMVMTMNGTYSPQNIDMTMKTETDLMGKATTMEVRVSGRRVGECTAATKGG